MSPSWLALVLELSDDDWDAGEAFWSAATGDDGYPVGRDIALGPPATTPHLLLRHGGRHTRVALDLHGPPADDGAALIARGAHATDDPDRLISPSGFGFTLRPVLGGPTPAPPRQWPSGHRSRVDQLTVDINPRCWDVERDFWLQLTGGPLRDRPGSPFSRIETPAALPVRLLLQRKEHGWTSAHLDIATDQRDLEVERLRSAGAHRIGEGRRWTVLAPPVGPLLCVTDRSPSTGLPDRSDR